MVTCMAYSDLMSMDLPELCYYCLTHSTTPRDDKPGTGSTGITAPIFRRRTLTHPPVAALVRLLFLALLELAGA